VSRLDRAETVPLDDDAARAAQAEAVRLGLVRLRGGAPFLSPGDAAALVRWLDAGTPVARILAAVEQAASRRHARRIRAPLQLRHAEPFLRDGPRRAAPIAAEPVVATPGHPLVAVQVGLDHTALDPLLRPLADALAGDLVVLDPTDPQALADAAGDRIVAFFDAAWAALGDGGRARYLARAGARLADFLDELDETLRDALLEEHARGILRDEVPCLSLSSVLLLVDA
jgi:hypothetical protein